MPVPGFAQLDISLSTINNMHSWIPIPTDVLVFDAFRSRIAARSSRLLRSPSDAPDSTPMNMMPMSGARLPASSHPTPLWRLLTARSIYMTASALVFLLALPLVSALPLFFGFIFSVFLCEGPRAGHALYSFILCSVRLVCNLSSPLPGATLS